VLRDAPRRRRGARGGAGRRDPPPVEPLPHGGGRPRCRGRRRRGARPRPARALKTIVYLHGFISSPRSKKAVMLGDYLRNCVAGVEYVVPELHHRPARAFEALL